MKKLKHFERLAIPGFMHVVILFATAIAVIGVLMVVLYIHLNPPKSLQTSTSGSNTNATLNSSNSTMNSSNTVAPASQTSNTNRATSSPPPNSTNTNTINIRGDDGVENETESER